MIGVQRTDTSMQIVLVTDDQGDGIFDWPAGHGYLIAGITLQTPTAATERFIALCKENETQIAELERALWTTPPGMGRMKPSNALEKFLKRLLKQAGVVDS